MSKVFGSFNISLFNFVLKLCLNTFDTLISLLE